VGRSVYTGTGRTAEEIMMDEIAAALHRDPVQFRLDTLKEEKAKACLRWVRDTGSWGRSMVAGTAQGVAVNTEHRSAVACLVEIDLRGTEPRVTKAVLAFDAGIPMNPSGLEQQMLGGLNDGISATSRAGLVRPAWRPRPAPSPTRTRGPPTPTRATSRSTTKGARPCLPTRSPSTGSR